MLIKKKKTGLDNETRVRTLICHYLVFIDLMVDLLDGTQVTFFHTLYIVSCRGALQLGGPFQGYPPRV